MDMYTRVKRARRRVKRDMYGMPIAEEEELEENHTEEDATTENEEEVRQPISLIYVSTYMYDYVWNVYCLLLIRYVGMKHGLSVHWQQTAYWIEFDHDQNVTWATIDKQEHWFGY